MSLIFNAIFRRKEADIETEKCKVTKAIELTQSDFEYFSKHLLNNYDFILENRDCMGYEDDVRCCMLVLSENSNDGILVDAQGSAYARYSSFLPNAREMIALNNYEFLRDFNKEIIACVDECVEKALQGQTDGNYYLKESELQNPIEHPFFNYSLLGEMLSERAEFECVETMSDEIAIAINPEYLSEDMDSDMSM